MSGSDDDLAQKLVTKTNRICINSKFAVPESIFIPIIGEVFDGHDFISEAIKNGATEVYCSRDVQNLIVQYPQVQFYPIDDGTLFLGAIARYYIKYLRELNSQFRVVAITGSVGKTTTKDLVGQLLTSFGATVFPKESYNNEIGLPLTVLKASPQTRFLVLEVGANHVGEVGYLTAIAQPDVAVLLKVGVAHAGEFGGANVIQREKVQIFKQHQFGPTTCIFQADDTNSPEILQHLCALHNVKLDSSVSNQVVNGVKYIALTTQEVNNIQLDDHLRISFELQGVRFSPKLSGQHHIYNVLAAIQVVKQLLCS